MPDYTTALLEAHLALSQAAQELRQDAQDTRLATIETQVCEAIETLIAISDVKENHVQCIHCGLRKPLHRRLHRRL
jgi:hypothetical protein